MVLGGSNNRCDKDLSPVPAAHLAVAAMPDQMPVLCVCVRVRVCVCAPVIINGL